MRFAALLLLLTASLSPARAEVAFDRFLAGVEVCRTIPLFVAYWRSVAERYGGNACCEKGAAAADRGEVALKVPPELFIDGRSAVHCDRST